MYIHVHVCIFHLLSYCMYIDCIRCRMMYNVQCSVCQELLRDGQSLEEQVKIDLAVEDHDSHIYDSLHPTTSPVGSPFHSNGVQVSCVHVCTCSAYSQLDPLMCSRMKIKERRYLYELV